MGEGRLLQQSPLYRGSRLLNQYIPCHGRLGSSTNGNGTSCGLESRELLVEDASSFGGEKETAQLPLRQEHLRSTHYVGTKEDIHVR